MKNLQKQIYNFFEHPNGVLAITVQILIFLLIFISVGSVLLDIFNHQVYQKYSKELFLTNNIILVVFTVEFILRLFASPKKQVFIKKPQTALDFIAIAPNYLEFAYPLFINSTALRVLRVVRILRIARVLRILRLYKYNSIFKKIFIFQKTILESIFPIIIMFVCLKAVIWILEYFHFWISNQDLGNLFAIVGFALGIILSQKIQVSYDKFTQVDEAIVRLYSNLNSLTLLLGKTQLAKNWAKSFLLILENQETSNFEINYVNNLLFQQLLKNKEGSDELLGLYYEISRDAAFCLSKKIRLAPKAYDTLLHQSTILYLVCVALFIPGLTGMISIVIGTYILYGMYNLTQDLDSILGGEYNLINIDMTELKQFVFE